MEFASHGRFALAVDGPLLVVEVDGPWNLELLHEYEAATRPYAEALSRQGDWVLLAVMQQSALFPAEAIEALRAAVQGHVEEARRIGTAVVIAPSVEGYGIVEPIYDRVYGGICEVVVFETRDAAERWSHDLLSRDLAGKIKQ